jgi:hypothetical protein
VIPGGLGHPRVLNGNTAMMRHSRPPIGTYFLNNDTDSFHQWNGVEWEGVGGSGSPEKTALLLLFQKQAEARQAASVQVGAGSGSTPGIRDIVAGDPSVNDPALFTAPPAPSGLPTIGGIDVPILGGRGGDGRGASGYGNGSGAGGGMTTGAAGAGLISVFDTFEGQTLAGTWGSVRPSGLFPYVTSGTGTRVVGVSFTGYGFLNVGGAGLSGSARERCNSAGTPWQDAAGFDMRCLVSFTSVPGAGQSGGLFIFLPGINRQIEIEVSSDPARGLFQMSDASFVSVVKTDWVANQLYWIRWERGAPSSAVSRAKIWPVGLAEPLAWTLTTTGAVAGAVTNIYWEYANFGAALAAALEARVHETLFA